MERMMNRLEEIIKTNLNGLSSVMDKETHLFYKDVIVLCMQQYAKECIEASLLKASQNENRYELIEECKPSENTIIDEEGHHFLSYIYVDKETITSQTNVVLL